VLSIRYHLRQVLGPRCQVPSAHQAASRAKTNWHTYHLDSMAFSSILIKRTGRPKLMIQQDLILKLPEKFIRCKEPSAVNNQSSEQESIDSETNWHGYSSDSRLFSSILAKRTGRPKLLIQHGLILKSREKFIRCKGPAAVSNGPSAEESIDSETNWHGYSSDSRLFSSILGKRTGRPNLLIQHSLILKSRKKFIRFEEPSAISHQQSAAGSTNETNCQAHVSESRSLTSILAKRTVRPKPSIQQHLILKILKRFIRCHLQIDGTVEKRPGLEETRSHQ
jgi:hypothetical protein